MKLNLNKLSSRDIAVIKKIADGEKMKSILINGVPFKRPHEVMTRIRFKTEATTTIQLVSECIRQGVIK